MMTTPPLRFHTRLIGAALAVLLAGWAAAAQAEYPERPIRLIVPFPPGGAVDVTARLVTPRLADDLKTSFVIENRGGAGGVIASEAVAKAAPDGYTLLLTAPNHTINAALQSKLPFDTEKDFAPVAIVAAVPELLVAHPSVPFRDFAGFVDYARKNPGRLNYSSAGNGTLPHVTMELLLRRLGLEVAHIPYRGAAPAMIDLLAGQVQLKLDTYATASQHVAAGKLHALAYAGAQRSDLMPDLPTVAEMGLRGYEGVLWIGLVAPAGTPKPVIEKLAASVRRVIAAPELAERLKRDGIEPVGGTSQEFGALITREIAQWRELAKSVNITLD
jgi:tripartite-type tricarboxylate transporter receptor subunit TctC